MTSDTPAPTPVAYSPAKAAAALGIGRTEIYRRLASGQIRGRKLGRRTLIPASELERFLDDLPDCGLSADAA